VPYLDVEGLARVVRGLAAQPRHCRELGEAARRKVARSHDAQAQAPKILRSIERCLQAA